MIQKNLIRIYTALLLQTQKTSIKIDHCYAKNFTGGVKMFHTEISIFVFILWEYLLLGLRLRVVRGYNVLCSSLQKTQL